MLTTKELCKELRESENKKILQRGKYTGGSDYMKNRLQIFDVGKLFINENSIYETLAKLTKEIPISELAATPLSKYYSLATCSETPGSKYKKLGGGWYLMANYPVVRVALALNSLFDRLELRLIAKITDR